MSPPLTVPPPSFPLATSILLPSPSSPLLLPTILSHSSNESRSLTWKLEGSRRSSNIEVSHKLSTLSLSLSLAREKPPSPGDRFEKRTNMLHRFARLKLWGRDKNDRFPMAGSSLHSLRVVPANRLTVLFGLRAISVKFHPPGGVAWPEVDSLLLGTSKSL